MIRRRAMSTQFFKTLSNLTDVEWEIQYEDKYFLPITVADVLKSDKDEKIADIILSALNSGRLSL